MKPYFAFQWHITDACDQRCKHCYIFSENACKPIVSMTWEQMLAVVGNCEEMCPASGGCWSCFTAGKFRSRSWEIPFI